MHADIIHSREWDVYNSLGFWNTNSSPNLSQKTIQWKLRKSTCCPVKFVVSVNDSENKRKRKDSLILVPCWRTLRDMRMMVIPFLIGETRTIRRYAGKDWRNWKSEEELRSSNQDRLEYWEESWRPENTYCHADSSERPPWKTGVKNSRRVQSPEDERKPLNTEKSPGDFRRLVVIQTPVTDDQQTLVRKTHKRET